MTINKNHYYFSVDDYGAIIDAHFAYEEAAGKPVEWLNDHRKAVWDAKFRLYVETEKILERIKDPACSLFPLYRWLGQDDEDYIFESRQDAEKEYIDQINRAIADRLYDL